MGDYNGIGPEIAIKALAKTDLQKSIPVWIGSNKVFQQTLSLTGISLPFNPVDEHNTLKPGCVYVLDPFNADEIVPDAGNISPAAGRAAMIAVETGAELCLENYCHALVTAPISKEAISKAGYIFPGHTEFLAEITKSDNVMMMLVNGPLRVALSTIHIPISEVAGAINSQEITNQLKILHNILIQDFQIGKPKIAVLGLNPHAGDGGVIGTEEINIIQPALKKAELENINIEGPFAADGFFGSGSYKNYDVTLAMYHDQGLIPFKTLSFGKGVNFTANLNIIRTSPDHGTAFAIAGQNKADEQSFLEAYNLAVDMAVNRIKISV